ncbi:MAG: hypothetical protein J0I98_05025 [Mesorhizobium sp.]|nr:hypothetical protein [Mesorhizobium sp.]MBN9242136.1 hypothetical protein [Mesorhizobium sp.]
MSAFFRLRVEATIERLIAVLDEMDGDSDLEPEPVEEQDDRELDPAESGIGDELALRAILAEYAKRQRRRAR